MINPSYAAFFFLFWATFGGKMGVVATRPLIVWGLQTQPKSWGLQTQPKSWPIGWTLWVNCYLEIKISKFSGENTPSLINVCTMFHKLVKTFKPSGGRRLGVVETNIEYWHKDMMSEALERHMSILFSWSTFLGSCHILRELTHRCWTRHCSFELCGFSIYWNQSRGKYTTWHLPNKELLQLEVFLTPAIIIICKLNKFASKKIGSGDLKSQLKLWNGCARKCEFRIDGEHFY